MQDLLSQGGYVSILDRSEPSEGLKASKHVKYFTVDIREVDQISDAVEKTVEWTKETGAVLGGVINCAGVGTAAKIIDSRGMYAIQARLVCISYETLITEALGEPHSLDLWDFTLAVNLTGSFNLTRLALKHLVKVDPEQGSDGERGVVIFVASAAAVSLLSLLSTVLLLVASYTTFCSSWKCTDTVFLVFQQ